MDKFRPRKPKFFNRVHSGYSWNSYNRTHYDHDNPPPKSVQGYKFNIFYPDLVDKSKAPTYHLLPTETPETVMLVFRAGPPYEDIAFKIVNGEWMIGVECCCWLLLLLLLLVVVFFFGLLSFFFITFSFICFCCLLLLFYQHRQTFRLSLQVPEWRVVVVVQY